FKPIRHHALEIRSLCPFRGTLALTDTTLVPLVKANLYCPLRGRKLERARSALGAHLPIGRSTPHPATAVPLSSPREYDTPHHRSSESLESRRARIVLHSRKAVQCLPSTWWRFGVVFHRYSLFSADSQVRRGAALLNPSFARPQP